MKKAITLCLLSLIASVSIVAQSSSAETNIELKKQTKIRQVVKIDKLKIKPAVKLESQSVNQTVQPVNKEEEVKSIETKQK